MPAESTTRMIATALIIGAVGALFIAAYNAFVPEETAPLQKPTYLVVQEIYEKGRSSTDCARIDSALSEIEPFIGDRSPLPHSQIESVQFPRRRTNATIGDFAIDRKTRLTSHRLQNCR